MSRRGHHDGRWSARNEVEVAISTKPPTHAGLVTQAMPYRVVVGDDIAGVSCVIPEPIPQRMLLQLPLDRLLEWPHARSHLCPQ
jgi:hypothetical protein